MTRRINLTVSDEEYNAILNACKSYELMRGESMTVTAFCARMVFDSCANILKK